MLKKNGYQIILFFFLLLWQQVLLAAPLQILGVEVKNTAEGVVRCDFLLNRLPLYRAFGLNGPPRIVIDFDDTMLLSRINHAQLTNTPIKNIRVGKHENNSLRVVLDTAHATGFRVATSKDSNVGKAHLIVTIAYSPNLLKSHAEKADKKAEKEKTAKNITAKKAAITKSKTENSITASTTASTKKNTELLAATSSSSRNVKKGAAAVSYYEVEMANVNNAPKLNSAAAVSLEAATATTTKAQKETISIIPLPVPPLDTKKETKVATAINSQVAKAKVDKTKVTTSLSVAPSATVSFGKPTFVSNSSVSKKNPALASSPIDPKASVALLEPDSKQKPRDIVVVIDPGHGGKDPGAHGAKGTKEKDVVLVIAKNLQNYLNNQEGYSAILTRDGDYYVGLHERLRIAHVNKADIFLSLHADAYKSRVIKGTTLFALSSSGATSEAARWLAEKENVSELGGDQTKSSTALRSILLDLAQKSSIRTSLLMGNSILSSLTTINNLHTVHIEQADFVVLQSPDIPSLLVESGYLSDPIDEQRLNDPLFQEMFAKALARGVMNYFVKHPIRGTVVGANTNVLIKNL
jgi:N-acetylmuramoyl-L-alanine amidase